VSKNSKKLLVNGVIFIG